MYAAKVTSQDFTKGQTVLDGKPLSRKPSWFTQSGPYFLSTECRLAGKVVGARCGAVAGSVERVSGGVGESAMGEGAARQTESRTVSLHVGTKGGYMTQTAVATTCQECGADRSQLRKWLDEPNILTNYPDGSPFWGKTDNQLKAESIVFKCNSCQKWYWRREN